MANSPITKTCTYCNTTKPITDFGKHKACKDGLNPQCKQCNRERVSAYQREHGEAYKAKKHAYDKARWAAGFGKSRQEWRRTNREHLSAKKREWAEANPEKARAIKATYKYRRRTQERAGMSWRELMAWRLQQKPCCYWCGDRKASLYTVDHYIPLSKGGKHEAGNLVIACHPCNLRKNAKDPLDFAREVGRLL